MQPALKLNEPIHNFPLEDRLADVGPVFLMATPVYDPNLYLGYHKASSIKTKDKLTLHVRPLTYESAVETAIKYL